MPSDSKESTTLFCVYNLCVSLSFQIITVCQEFIAAWQVDYDIFISYQHDYC